MVVGSTETVYGQFTIPDSCICYTDYMDKQALECKVTAIKKDKIISNKQLQIINLMERLSGKNKIAVDNKEIISKITKENQEIKLNLRQSRRSRKIYGGVGFVVGVIGTIFIIK